MKPLSFDEPAAIWPVAPVWTYPGVDVGLPYDGTLAECLDALSGASPGELARVFIEISERVIEAAEIEALMRDRDAWPSGYMGRAA